MKLAELLDVLTSRDAFIVHCVRSSRNAELENKPIYPEDLTKTIDDLKNGGVRYISCSVVWPAHQKTYGEVGIIVKPRSVEEIKRLSTGDAGTLQDGDAIGELLSVASVGRIFDCASDYNEWILTGGEVVGIFVNFEMGLNVARVMDKPLDISEEEWVSFGASSTIGPFPITVSEIALDFPGCRLFGFVGGVLMEIDSSGEALKACHPYDKIRSEKESAV